MIDTDRQNSVAISCPLSPNFATRCLLQPEQRILVDESGMIRTQMGSTLDQKMIAVGILHHDSTNRKLSSIVMV
jgi:hypothetical protein